jgi:CRP-like cAMP-binding protein
MAEQPVTQDISSNPNLLLRGLSLADVTLLGPLEHANLALRQPLEAAHSPNDRTYFIESGIASIVADTPDGEVEIGIIGQEGMTGIGIIYGDMQTPFRTFVQIAGAATSCKTAALLEALDSSHTLRTLLLAYARLFSIQVATTAVANGRSKLEERLARWMLMIGDRQGSTFLITHEFLAVMLAVRRSGVTEAMHALESKGCIKAARGQVHIADRAGLIIASRGSYGLAEEEGTRLRVAKMRQKS